MMAAEVLASSKLHMGNMITMGGGNKRHEYTWSTHGKLHVNTQPACFETALSMISMAFFPLNKPLQFRVALGAADKRRS